MKIILLSILCLLTISVFSQNRKTDSLINKLEFYNNQIGLNRDTNCYNISLKLGRLFRGRDNFKAKHYTLIALKYANNDLIKIAKTYNLAGTIYFVEAAYDSAKYYNNQSIIKCDVQLSKNNIILNDIAYQIKAFALGNLGLVYSNLSDYKNAYDVYFKAQKINDKISNIDGSAANFGNIGLLFTEQKQYDKALIYAYKSFNIYNKKNNTLGMGAQLSNIAMIYDGLNKEDSALIFYFKALKYHKLNNNNYYFASTLHDIGVVKMRIGQADTALICFINALKINKEIGNKEHEVKNLNEISLIYNNNKKYNESKITLNEAIKLSSEINSINGLRDSYEILSKLYANTNEVNKEYDAYKNYILYRDSIQRDENNKASFEKEMKYEFDKKESELLLQQEKNDIIYREETRRKKIEFQFKTEQEKLINKKNIDQLTYSENLKREKLNNDFNQKKALLKTEKIKSDIENKARRKQQQIVILGVASCLAIVILFSIFLFRRFKITQKQKHIIELKEQETQQQNGIITLQKHLVEEKHKEITDSINYAERIQRSFLASEKLLDENLKNYFIFFKPKDIVSGDFYWGSKTVSSSGAENFTFVTADSTGHGVPGAIMSLLNITSLEKAIEQSNNPAEILNLTRQTIISRLKNDGSETGGKDGMDCTVLSIDFKNNILNCAASNNPIWIIRNNELIEIKPDKMPVGKHDKDSEPFTLHTIQIYKEDLIYTLTDGFPDQFGGEKGKKFMSKNLKELLLNNVYLPMNEQKQLLEITFSNWIGDLEQIDDVTVIGIKI